ncbi:MAG: hypothetical protein Q8J97_11610, partial [Flavobacteriaceae bacterium]|nr:hypothetical protein [Flavobacteriaceae bacterium]
SVRCPGLGSASGMLCSAHGRCLEGVQGSGQCVCDADYFGADCGVHCTVALCKARGLVHPMCDRASGACVCEQLAGVWAGPTCNDCADNFWGPFCSLPCDCNFHGTCERFSGTCSCFRDAERGYWKGQSCAVCFDGYIGLQCRSKNIELSVNVASSSAGAVAAMANLTRVMTLADPWSNATYVGGDPLVVFAVTAGDADDGQLHRAPRHTISAGRVVRIALECPHIATPLVGSDGAASDVAAALWLEEPRCACTCADAPLCDALQCPGVLRIWVISNDGATAGSALEQLTVPRGLLPAGTPLPLTRETAAAPPALQQNRRHFNLLQQQPQNATTT